MKLVLRLLSAYQFPIWVVSTGLQKAVGFNAMEDILLNSITRRFALVAVLLAAATVSEAGSLHTAIQQDDLSQVEQEISNGADVSEEDMFLGAPIVLAAILGNVIDKQRRQLQKQLTLDPLTGLLNRLTFNDRMQQVVYEHIHQDKKVSLLAIDVDHFKSLNDTHGHAVGDRVLRAIGQTFRETLRQDDAVFRMGGEEFTAILIGADEDAATETAERVRQHVAEHSFNIGSAVTVSIGVSEHRYDESWENWAKRGDDRLYAAKRKGRNRVVAAHLQEIGNVHLVNLI